MIFRARVLLSSDVKIKFSSFTSCATPPRVRTLRFKTHCNRSTDVRCIGLNAMGFAGVETSSAPWRRRATHWRQGCGVERDMPQHMTVGGGLDPVTECHLS